MKTADSSGSRPRGVIANPWVGAPIDPLDPRIALDFHRSLPSYRVTPLLRSSALADRLGVASVHVKDESHRLGLPSFKVVGASWATFRTLCSRFGADPADIVDMTGLRALVAGSGAALIAATDGNHGRAVAHLAGLLGLRSRVIVPQDMTPARVEAIAAEGAEVTVIGGTYDDAVACSSEMDEGDCILISDTSWPGYEVVPALVIEGYGTIAAEVLEALERAEDPPPSVVVVQVGVGAFASSMVRTFVPAGASVVAVEPTKAACLQASIEAGTLVTVGGNLDSTMAGLNCGTPSQIAWPSLRSGVGHVATVDDEDAADAVRLLASIGVISGESGAAGLAGLLAFGADLGLTEEDRVLVISTEGATDPITYARTVRAG